MCEEIKKQTAGQPKTGIDVSVSKQIVSQETLKEEIEALRSPEIKAEQFKDW